MKHFNVILIRLWVLMGVSLLLCLGESGQSTIKKVLPGMVLVKGGTFMMGSSEGPLEEVPVHTVILDSYHIRKYPANREFASA